MQKFRHCGRIRDLLIGYQGTQKLWLGYCIRIRDFRCFSGTRKLVGSEISDTSESVDHKLWYTENQKFQVKQKVIQCHEVYMYVCISIPKELFLSREQSLLMKRLLE